MALTNFTASTDFAGKGKRLYFWNLSQGVGAQTINFRDGGATGAIKIQVQMAASSSLSFSFNTPPWFASLYVEVVGTGFTTGCVDIG